MQSARPKNWSRDLYIADPNGKAIQGSYFPSCLSVLSTQIFSAFQPGKSLQNRRTSQHVLDGSLLRKRHSYTTRFALRYIWKVYYGGSVAHAILRWPRICTRTDTLKVYDAINNVYKHSYLSTWTYLDLAAFLSRLGSSEGPLPSMSRAAMSLESFQARVRHLFTFVSPLLRQVYSSWEDERFYLRSTSRYPLCLSTTSWRMDTGLRNDFGLLLGTIARPQRAVPIHHRWLLLRFLRLLFRSRLRTRLLLRLPTIRTALLLQHQVLAKQVAEFTSNLLHHIFVRDALPFVLTKLPP